MKEQQCFCGGDLIVSHVKHYKKCVRCGSYASTAWVEPKKIYQNNYWTHEMGRSTLQEQWENHTMTIDGKSPRMDFWVDMLTKNGVFEIKSGLYLEIGCAPGAMVDYMAREGWGSCGIECDRHVCDWIEKKIEIPIWEGYFPKMLDAFNNKWDCDLIASFDTIEHSPDPVAFINKCAEISKPSSWLLLQCPTVLPSDNRFAPFKNDTDRMFKEDEHVYIFSQGGLVEMAKKAGYHLIDSGRWQPGHECFLFKK